MCNRKQYSNDKCGLKIQDFISINAHKATGPLYNYNILCACHIKACPCISFFKWQSFQGTEGMAQSAMLLPQFGKSAYRHLADHKVRLFEDDNFHHMLCNMIGMKWFILYMKILSSISTNKLYTTSQLKVGFFSKFDGNVLNHCQILTWGIGDLLTSRDLICILLCITEIDIHRE